MQGVSEASPYPSARDHTVFTLAACMRYNWQSALQFATLCVATVSDEQLGPSQWLKSLDLQRLSID